MEIILFLELDNELIFRMCIKEILLVDLDIRGVIEKFVSFSDA